MLPSELTNTIEQFIVHVDQNEAHFTYIYVYHTNEFEAVNIYKNPPLNVTSPIFFGYIYFALGLHPRLCGLLERAQIPSCPRQIQTCVRPIQGWVVLAGWPPKQKSWPRHNVSRVMGNRGSTNAKMGSGKQGYKMCMGSHGMHRTLLGMQRAEQKSETERPA